MNKEIKKLLDNLDQAPEKQCKDADIGPLLQMADTIKKSANIGSDAPTKDFKNQLKEKILTGRANKKDTFNPFNMIKELFKTRFFAPALAGVLIVAVLFTTMYVWSPLNLGGEKNIFSEFSKLVINSAYANDNFELSPTKKDSLGVEADSKYVLKSKQPLDTSLIKENLKIDPAVDYDLTAISDKEWEIDIKDPLKLNSLLGISLAISYVDESGAQLERDYSWAYQVKDSFKVLYSIPRNEATNVPVDTGIEISFSHDNFHDFDKYFSISPKVKGKFEKHGRTAVFVPTEVLNPKTIYTVTLKTGVPLDNSQESLNKDYSFSFETIAPESGDDNYSFNMYGKFSEFSTSEKPLMSLYSHNIKDGLSFKVYRFNSPNEFVSALKELDSLPKWSSSYDDYRFDVSKLKETMSFIGVANTESKGLEYVEFPDKLDAGFYVADVSYKEMTSQIFIQSSDLLTYVNAAENYTLVWVNDLKTGMPVSGAKIEFIDSNYKSETDKEGIAKFETPDDFSGQLSVYLKVQKDEDTLILRTSELLDFDSEEKTYSDYWKYFYTDRPLYLPNDTIKFWGMLKDRSGEKIKEKITVSLYKSGYVDYYYQPVKIVEQEITLDNFGSFTGEIQIKDLYPDYYNLEINVGDLNIATKYISIEEYVKPAYELTLNSDKDFAFAGDTVNFTAKAGFFEGTPVPNLKLIYSTPNGEKNATTNEMGEISFSYKKPYFDCGQKYSCWPEYGEFSVRPEDGELAEISASRSMEFYGPDIYLTGETKYPEPGKAQISFQTNYIDFSALENNSWWDYSLGEEPAPNVKIEGTVTKITHTKKETGTYYDFIDKKTYKQYQYDRKEEVVDNFKIYSDESGNYTYERPVLPETSYEIDVKFYDKNGKYDVNKFYLYYYNGSFIGEDSSYGDYNYYHFKLDNDAKEISQYKLGESVESYFMNKDELLQNKKDSYLYMQMRNGLQGYSVSDSSVYNFNFGDDDVPNVELVGIYFNGNSYNSISRSVYYNNSEKALKINISPDKDKYQPGEEAELKVYVTDMNDNPVEAEVNLNLVDEAYYALAEDYADPIESIYSSISSGEIFSTTSHRFYGDQYGGAEKGGCFAAGTMITMSDGAQKPIEEIVVGDKIKTFSNPIDKNLVEGVVTETYEHLVSGYLLINGNLKVTPEHLVFVDSHFEEAGGLKAGDFLLKSDGTKLKVDTIKMISAPTKVYNFRVDPEHTYFADGIYVHNEKGGGPREFFTDAALFEVIKTDTYGRGETKFNLPDNVTSWRVTAQAISKDLYVGINTLKVPVSLPVFAEITMADEYLAADSPIAKVRAFGSALGKDDDIKFSLESPGIDAIKGVSKAFESIYLPLPDFPLGKTSVTYSLETAKGNDAVKLPLDIVESRLQVQSAVSKELTTDTKIDFPNNKPVLVVLGDKGQNQLYGALEDLSWDYGDRIDQKLAQKESRKLLHEYYKEEVFENELKSTNYQLSNGGISLLPYSSDDLELSARVAALGADGFDKDALGQYLFGKLEDKNSNQEEVTLALFGLAELNQPVLTRLSIWLETREDLSATEKLYLAQALADLGDKESARKIYYELIDKYGEGSGSYVILKVSNDKDEIFRATALSAVLASSLNAPESMSLWNYLDDAQVLYGIYKNSETLFSLERANFAKHMLPQLKPSPASVAYELAGKKSEITLTGGEMHSFQLYPEQKDKLKFKSIKGDVGITIVYTTSFDENSVKRFNDISIDRKYYVDGVATNEFKEGDVVEVRLLPKVNYGNISLEITEFQITDTLPSGLAPMTKLESQYDGKSSYCLHYPYNVNGQEVKFSYYKGDACSSGEIRYLARVKTLGEYLAEPAVIQAYLDPEIINYSKQEEIKITE